MNEAIRQNIASCIYSLSSLEKQLETCLDQIKHQTNLTREGSSGFFADVAEEFGVSRNLGRRLGGRVIPSKPEYWRYPGYVGIENQFTAEMVRIKSMLSTISIRIKGDKFEAGEKYVKIIETDILGSPLKQQIRTTIKYLKKLAKKELVYTNAIPSLVEPKPARRTNVSEHIAIAKKNTSNPEVAINHIRTVISLLIQDKFGFDVKNIPQFVKICEASGVILPRNLASTYDLGSKNIHRGLAPSSSDIKAGIAFVEEFEKELKELTITETQQNQIRSRCETERVVFMEKKEL